MRFDFATAGRIVFGAGALKEAGGLAKQLGARPLVVTGGTPERAQPLVQLMRDQGMDPTGFAVDHEPDIDTVRLGVEAAREHERDCVIGFGGGAVIDAAKAIAALLTNPGDLLDYLEVVGQGRPLVEAPVPVIAIPTTAGTGSEVARNSVIVSPEHRVKVSLRSPLMLPKIALLDPELTYHLPPALTASTGLDALTQVIEPFVCTRANPLTDGLCREGMVRVARSLRQAVDNGRDASAREDMAVASLFGGLALANAGLGAVHGIAGPLGGMITAPHGAICAALLPAVMSANLRALRERGADNDALRRYRTVAHLLTGSPEATPDDAILWVSDLVNELEIPGLATYGLTGTDVPELVGKATRASSMKANPVELTPVELASVIHEAL